MVGHWKWLQMTVNDCKWLGMVRNDWEWLEMVRFVSPWTLVKKNGWKWLKMVGNGNWLTAIGLSHLLTTSGLVFLDSPRQSAGRAWAWGGRWQSPWCWPLASPACCSWRGGHRKASWRRGYLHPPGCWVATGATLKMFNIFTLWYWFEMTSHRKDFQRI